MSILNSIKPQFASAFPRLASGKYVHFLMVRHSQSFPVFQTDGVLNTARTQAGIDTKEAISRLVMFKRKQVSPERLVGRELLRSLNLIHSEDKKAENFCRYGAEQFCGKCPDCVIYGFAVGDSGSERSKVYSDSAFSLSAYQESHKSFTFNSLSESGTMMLDYDDPKRSDSNKVRSSINELDHVLPEITFPTVETLRDPTYEGFLYVLGNLMRTRRYGAQESRTGTMANHIIGIALCDGEIFSNLHFTQSLYDALKPDINAPIADIINKATEVVTNLLNQEPIRKTQVITGTQLNSLLTEVAEIYQDETRLRDTLTSLYQQTKSYAETYGAIAGKKGKGK
ncbi:type I-D CRISPR-associated protein Cas7/Csc2 [Nostoc sp. FACHB-87]|uniref:type I-D CRISPR-associated protein Cas7/Csc2 n=1 Tax=Nostocaceae TaxID=1162 RepID=UPI0016898E66|nr:MULTISPECIES: type I-D CRISPR-associated protein Cas7/Csc2 [Nostocaceae]MBD2458956.1 type I-D CRISPR-associated protein Cas7/Csc2 [Nostoc sp. FACHB-87]MBD2479954.1 type I-D CRISPR-associated protein Cas7/Csc2 [Anabaena sp. FACHB-83]